MKGWWVSRWPEVPGTRRAHETSAHPQPRACRQCGHGVWELSTASLPHSRGSFGPLPPQPCTDPHCPIHPYSSYPSATAPHSPMTPWVHVAPHWPPLTPQLPQPSCSSRTTRDPHGPPHGPLPSLPHVGNPRQVAVLSEGKTHSHPEPWSTLPFPFAFQTPSP